MLRCVVEIDVVSADQVTCGEFVNSMPAPTLINVVTMEPLEGNVVLEVNTTSLAKRLDDTSPMRFARPRTATACSPARP